MRVSLRSQPGCFGRDLDRVADRREGAQPLLETSGPAGVSSLVGMPFARDDHVAEKAPTAIYVTRRRFAAPSAQSVTAEVAAVTREAAANRG